MKVKLLVSRAGVNFSQSVGDEITVSDAEAMRMVKANQAEPVKQIETADKKQANQKRAKK